MQRDNKIVIDIMKGLAEHPGGMRPNGYVYVVSNSAMLEREKVLEIGRDNSITNGAVIIPEEICSEEIMFYHLDIMEEWGLVNKEKGGYGGYPCYRLSWDGNDFLDAFQQEGVIEEIESTQGDGWRHWTFEIVKSITTKLSERIILQSMGMG